MATIFAFLIVLTVLPLQDVDTLVVFLKVALGSAPNRTLPERFLGHAIDASIIIKREWELVDFNDEKLKRAMALLSPTYVRFGGIYSDHTIFVEKRPPDFSYEERRKQYGGKGKPGEKQNYTTREFEIFGEDIDRLLEFTESSGSRLLFCLNSRLHFGEEGNPRWNSTNMFQLVDYIISKNFTKIDFSIGNEPLKKHKITGSMIGSAVKELREKLRGSPLRRSKIIAPDVSRLQKFGLNIMNDTINKAGKRLSAASFHQYYLNGRNATWNDLIHPQTLDSLGSKILKAIGVVKSSKRSETPVWITESGSTYGGGTEGLSRSFVAALGYADKLGLAASLGISQVTRQSLFGGRYRLFNISRGYEPNPEYWVSYLFGILNGKIVRVIRSEPLFKHLRCYAFQSENQDRVTLMLINVHTTLSYTLRVVTRDLMRASRRDFHVTARGDPSVATEVLVNGRVLELPESSEQEFVPPEGKRRSGADSSFLPALSMLFSVYDMEDLNRAT